jgi:hypothetical protein
MVGGDAEMSAPGQQLRGIAMKLIVTVGSIALTAIAATPGVTTGAASIPPLHTN